MYTRSCAHFQFRVFDLTAADAGEWSGVLAGKTFRSSVRPKTEY